MWCPLCLAQMKWCCSQNVHLLGSMFVLLVYFMHTDISWTMFRFVFFLFQLFLVFLWLAANNINIITVTIPKSGTIKLNEQLLPRSKSSTGGWLQILFLLQPHVSKPTTATRKKPKPLIGHLFLCSTSTWRRHKTWLGKKHNILPPSPPPLQSNFNSEQQFRTCGGFI